MTRAKSPTRQAPTTKRAPKSTAPNPVAETSTPKYPHVEISLVGRDGNAFAILGAVGNALRAGQVSQDQINEFYTEARSGDYDHLLRTVMSWVNVV